MVPVAEAAAADAGVIRTALLPSGLNVVTERMPDVRSVALGFWVGVGARDEAPHQSGASHFLEHLLFKGTEERTATEIAEAIDAVGGELNAFTTKDHTAFHVRLLADHLDLALDVLSDIMWRPAFRPEEVEAERLVIVEELLMQADEPEELAQELLASALWPGHPLGREVLGSEPTVSAMGVTDLREFHDRRYRPGVTVLAAAGRLDHDRLIGSVEERFARSGRPPGGEPPMRAAPSASPERLVVRRRQTEQAHLVLGLPCVTRHDPDRHAATLLAQILGGGASSRLFQEVRERRGLAYAVYSFTSAYQDTGQAGLYMGTRPDNLAEALAVVGAELSRLREEPATPDELFRAKENLKGRVVLALESTGARMNRLGSEILAGAPLLSLDEVVERIEAVTLDDLGALVQELWAPERLSSAGIGPSEAQFDDALNAITPAGVV